MTSGATPTGSYSWKDGTEYEVKCQQTFAYYTGYVVDYDVESQKFHVCYENGWKADEQVNPSEIRPKAFPHEPDQWQPKENEKVEAKAKSEENEPFGWWPCFIRCIKGEFFLVNFEGWDDTHNEILGKEMLRPFNNKPALRSGKMTRSTITIKDDNADWIRERPPELLDLQQKTGLVHLTCRLNNGTSEIILIGDKKGSKRADLLIRNQLEYNKELTEIRTDLRKVQMQLQEKEQQFRTAFKEQFQVDVSLLPLVIGRKGKNIKDAETVQGVLKINVEDDGQVTIFAQSTDAASEAREILEIISKDIPVPSSAMGRIIGVKGANIQKIIKDSQVIRIKSQPQKTADGMDHFLITGTSENVETASILIETQLRHIEQLDTLRTQHQETQGQLRDNYGGGGGNYANFGMRGGYGGPNRDGPPRDQRRGGRGGGRDRGRGRGRGQQSGGNDRRGGGGGNRRGPRDNAPRDNNTQDKPARSNRSNRSNRRREERNDSTTQKDSQRQSGSKGKINAD